MHFPPIHSRTPSSETRSSAMRLEAAFLSEMLKSAGLTPKPDSGGTDSPFASYMTDLYARALVARGGIGLSAQIESALVQRARGTR